MSKSQMWEFVISKFKIEESMELEPPVVVLVSSTKVVLDLGFKSIVNFQSIIVDLFTLRIVRLNLPHVFTLKWLVSLVFLGLHITVFFNFLH